VSALYLAALGITLCTEVPVVTLLYPGQRLRLGAACAVTTAATHLTMHFVLPGLLPAGTPALLAGEALATLAEATVYLAVSRPRDPGRALVASALANSLSFGAGLVLL
jgi:hypothetical protein